MKATIENTSDGLEIIDPIERIRQRLLTPKKVEPVPSRGRKIPYPVDTTRQIITNSLTVLTKESIYVHNDEGVLIAEVNPNQSLSLPDDRYVLDISSGMKVYFAVDSSMDIDFGSEDSEISFGSATEVVIGARSFHTNPAGTIKTTTDPSDLMKAVSLFSSALKTTSVERSYATLRGHPPIIELGNKLNIPDQFERPETGITIEIPSDVRHVLVVAPLAYYLGAKVVPGAEPLLRTPTGYSFRLGNGDEFESTVERVLRQVFFLDCIVRTEGEGPGPLYERQVVEPHLEFDIEETYNESLASRTEIYLKEPFETVMSYLPTWPVTTKLEENEKNVKFLPHLVEELSVIYTTQDDTFSNKSASHVLHEETRATAHQRWNTVRSSTVMGRSPLSAFRHSLDRSPRSGPIKIEVVCNDPKMNSEFVSVHSKYEERDRFPLEVTLHHNLTKDEFGDILAKNSDFLHYIGHIDREGFRCSNGKIDASKIDTVGATAFFLNACQSYRQGRQLIELGSQAGIVTLDDVKNREAVEVGSIVAQLLSHGFPMYATMDITRTVRTGGQQYQIIGAGKTTVSQPESGSPLLGIIKRKLGKRTIDCHTYITELSTLGGIHRPRIEPVDAYHLFPGNAGETPVTKRQLVDFLESGDFPVLLDSELRWSKEIKTTEL
ncbi:hypothetical protein ACFO5R_04170 [Halosolutus amylolyticus]|uniref:CHAT domain-containing protein n=1 Tax=Halosolutus amylolyticus TaxID=2932267 RepID=A0ABD5PKL4_9EURY|nr:hypothetical protein [Halosolutus amylolyticus]